MGLCSQLYDSTPNGFFLIDVYQRHDKYRGLKHSDWMEFSFIDVAEVEKEFI